MNSKLHIPAGYRTLAARIAGASIAVYLLVGRWSPERLLGIESSRYFEMSWQMLLEPRHWTLPILLVTLLTRRAREFSWEQYDPRKSARPAFYALTAMFGYLLLTTTWAVEPSMAILKAYDVTLMFSIAALAGLWLASQEGEEFQQGFWWTLTLLTGTMACMALVSLTNLSRIAVLGGGPNVFARLMFLLAVGSLAITNRRTPLQLVAPVVAVALIVLSGSRGAMLATVAGVMTFLIVERVSLATKLQLIGAATVVGVLVSFTSVGRMVYSQFSHRVIELTLQEHYLSDRDVLLADALEIWREHPIFGAGLSGWASTYHDSAYQSASHPHNIFSEMLCEGGLVAVTLLLGFLFAVGLCAWRRRELINSSGIAAMAMFLVACQFSGDFFDSRGLFLCAVFALQPGASLADEFYDEEYDDEFFDEDAGWEEDNTAIDHAGLLVSKAA